MKFEFTRLLMWMGIAAAAAYVLDPDKGDGRRKDLRKRFQAGL